MQRLTRRAFIAGGVGLGAATTGWLELQALRGEYDHRDPVVAGRASASAFARALQQLERDVHAPALIHIGHSTHLLALAGKRLLTDPWFHDPAHGGMRHAHGPATTADRLGALDVVLITHEHPDHADPRALDQLDKRAHCLVGTRPLVALCKRLGFAAVTQLAQWETVQLGPLAISATPAVHDVPEVGFAITAHAAPGVYFAGDTAQQPRAFAEIAERYAPAVAILPIDGTQLRTDRRWVMNPEEAAAAAHTLGVRLALPSHHDAHFTDGLLRLWAKIETNPAQRFDQALRTSPIHCTLPTPAQLLPL